MLVRDLQAVIGEEARAQILAAEGRLPDVLIACVGGGSNALGLFAPFYDDTSVRMIGVEAGGEGVEQRHATARRSPRAPRARCTAATPTCCRTTRGRSSRRTRSRPGSTTRASGPEHSFFKDSGRAEYVPVTDAEALDSFVWLSRTEGIIPAFESSHAIAELRRRAPTLARGLDRGRESLRPRRQGRDRGQAPARRQAREDEARESTQTAIRRRPSHGTRREARRADRVRDRGRSGSRDHRGADSGARSRGRGHRSSSAFRTAIRSARVRRSRSRRSARSRATPRSPRSSIWCAGCARSARCRSC